MVVFDQRRHPRRRRDRQFIVLDIVAAGDIAVLAGDHLVVSLRFYTVLGMAHHLVRVGFVDRELGRLLTSRTSEPKRGARQPRRDQHRGRRDSHKEPRSQPRSASAAEAHEYRLKEQVAKPRKEPRSQPRSATAAAAYEYRLKYLPACARCETLVALLFCGLAWSNTTQPQRLLLLRTMSHPPHPRTIRYPPARRPMAVTSGLWSACWRPSRSSRATTSPFSISARRILPARST